MSFFRARQLLREASRQVARDGTIPAMLEQDLRRAQAVALRRQLVRTLRALAAQAFGSLARIGAVTLQVAPDFAARSGMGRGRRAAGDRP